jgi:hypothetical protein
LVFLWKMKTGWCFQLVVVVYGGSRSGKGWEDGTMDSEGEFVSDGVIFYYWERERKIGYVGLIALKMVGKVLVGSMGVITSVWKLTLLVVI